MNKLILAQLEKIKTEAKIAKENFDTKNSESIGLKETAINSSQNKEIIKKNIIQIQKDWIKNFEEKQNSHQYKTQLEEILFKQLKDCCRELSKNGDKRINGKAAPSIKIKNRLTVSQWAEKHRTIDKGTPLPGKWQNKNAPHTKEIMDSLSVHSPVRSVTFMKSSGVSGTEIILNWLGYCLDYAQQDIMLVVPTIEVRDRTFNPKLQQLFSTEYFQDKINQKTRDERNRQDLLDFNGVRLVKSGANSPNSLRAEHLPNVVVDEFDAFPDNVGGEGDPDILINNRQKVFARAKTFYVSTPLKKGFSLIERNFLKGSQYYRYVPCPHCSKKQRLEFKNFVIDREFDQEGKKGLAIDAYFKCIHCEAKIEEKDKDEMLDKGVWIAKNPEQKKHLSFHLNFFYAKKGLGESWLVFAQKWIDAKGNDYQLESLINTYLAETTEYKGEAIDSLPLLARLEELPKNIENTIRCAGVDVQKDRIEATVFDFNIEEEAWGRTHIIAEGNPVDENVWRHLEQELSSWNIQIAAVDSGYLTQNVYQFCESRNWAVPVKGIAGSRPLIENRTKQAMRLRKRKTSGISAEPLGVDEGKAILFHRLKMTELGKKENRAGYIHFDNRPEFDEEYFKQLTAEVLVTKKSRGREFTVWEKTRNRNEAADCYIYALAVFRLKGKPYLQQRLGNQANNQSNINSTAQRQRRRR